MVKDKINSQPIGIIHTPFKSPEGIPNQPSAGYGVRGEIEIYPQYVEGLADLNGFSHIHLIYFLHKVREKKLRVIPYLDNKFRGIFATRAPSRPNAIGLSVVRLLDVRNNILSIENIDILDSTPLLDIKPYIPEVDQHFVTHIGWLEGKKMRFS